MKHLRLFTKHSLGAKVLSCVLAVAISFTVPLPKLANATESLGAESVTSVQNSTDAIAQNADGQSDDSIATQVEDNQSDADRDSQDIQADKQSNKSDTELEEDQTQDKSTDNDKDAESSDKQLSNSQDTQDNRNASVESPQPNISGSKVIRYISRKAIGGIARNKEAITLIRHPDKSETLDLGDDGTETIYYIDQFTFSRDKGVTPNWKPNLEFMFKIHGNVTLVIADGMDISINYEGAKNSHENAAIAVEDADSALTITAGLPEDSTQKEIQGTGILKCYAGYTAAAIGGSKKGKDGHDITIDACHVEAHTGIDNGEGPDWDAHYGGAAIGGACKGKGYNITINGGYVKAITYLEDPSGAAIGSGMDAGDDGAGRHYYDQKSSPKNSGGYNINITGGEVYAKAGWRAAAIGGGYMSSGHHITISGGKVTAMATHSGAGIGGGDNYNGVAWNDPLGYDILISGGEVKAYGGEKGGAGIGSGNGRQSYALKISGGTVEATPRDGAAAIGGGDGGDANCIEICGNANVTCNQSLVASERYTGIGSGRNAGAGEMKFYGSASIVAHGNHGAAIGSGGDGPYHDLYYTHIYGDCKIEAYQHGGNGAAIGAGDDCIVKGNHDSPDLRIDGSVTIKAVSYGGTPAIGNCTTDKKKKDDNMVISGDLKVIDLGSGDKLSATRKGGGYKWGDIRTHTQLLVGKPSGSDINLWLADTEDEFPYVGYESKVNYKLYQSCIDISKKGYSVNWYSDKDGKNPISAPAYLSVKADGSGWQLDISMNTCPDKDAADYRITPAGTYYFSISSTLDNGKKVQSNIKEYTIKKTDVNLTSGSAHKVYDGNPLTCHSYSEDEIIVAKKTSGDAKNPPFVIRKEVVQSCNFTGSQTELGTSKNYFSVDKLTGALQKDNYNFNYNYGDLLVHNQLTKMAVASNYNGFYDGKIHTFSAKVVSQNDYELSGWRVYYKTSLDGGKTWTRPTRDKPAVLDAITQNENNSLLIETYGEHPYFSSTSPERFEMVVRPRPVTINSSSAEKTYDAKPLIANNPSEDIEYQDIGFVDGEGVNIEFKPTSRITKAGSQTNEFEYTPKDGTKLSNYNITSNFGNLVVNKKTAPIVISTGSHSKIYDGKRFEVEDNDWSATYDIIETGRGDTLSVVLDQSKSQQPTEEYPAITDVGEYENSINSYIVKNGEEDRTDCYTFGNQELGTLVLSPRPLTLTSASKTKVYDGEPCEAKEVTVGGDGLVGGQELIYSDFASVTKPTKGAVDNTFNVSANTETGTNLKNYAMNVECGKLVVLELYKLSVHDQSYTYDGSAHEAKAEIVVGGPTPPEITYSYKTAAGLWTDWSKNPPSLTDAGTLSCMAKATIFGVDVVKEYTLSVTPRSVIISTMSASKQYDGTALTTGKDTYSIEGLGFVDGQGANINITGSQTEVGQSENSFSYTLKSGTKEGNYEITQKPGTLTVTQNTNPITITTGSNSWTYNGTPLACASYEYTGQIFKGDTLEVVTGGAITDVGSADNTIDTCRVVRDGRDITDYYTFATPVLGKLTVYPRSIYINTGSASKVYDGNALECHDYEEAGDGFIEGDGVTVNFTGTLTNAGSVANTAEYQLNEGTKAQNYVIAVNAGTLVVEKRKLTVESGSAVATTSVAEKTPLTNPEVSVSDPGFVVSESGVSECTVAAIGSQSNAGESENTVQYTWAAGANFANYDIAENLGRLVVVDDSTAAVASDYMGIYDGQGHDGEVKAFIESPDKTEYQIDGGAWSKDKPSIKDVKLNPITGEVESYNVNVKITKGTNIAQCSYKITIMSRPVNLTAGSDSKVYDGSALTCQSYAISGYGFVGSEGVSVTNNGTQTDVGSSLNTPTFTYDEGTLPQNYSITLTPGTLEVSKRKLTVTSGSAVKTVSVAATSPATNPNVDVSDPGFVVKESGPECEVTATGSRSELGESANTVNYAWASGAKPDNYDITESLGRLVVVEDSVSTVVATGYTGTYDAKAHGGTVATSLEGATIEYSEDGGACSSTAPTRKDVGTTNVRVRVTKGSNIVECEYNITIEKRNLVITPNSGTKVYDGTELDDSGYTIGGDGYAGSESADIEIKTCKTGTEEDFQLINVGYADNVVRGVTGKGGFAFENYNVVYNIGTLEVTKRMLVVSTGSAVATAESGSATSSVVSVSSPGFVMKGEVPECVVTANGEQSGIGESPNWASYSWAEGAKEDNYDITENLGRLVVVDDSHSTAVATGYTGVYDGQPHGGSVVTSVEGATIEYSTDKGTTYSKDAPTRIDAGTTSVLVRITKDSLTITCTYTIQINPRDLTLEAGSASKDYDGTALTCEDYIVGGDGFVEDEEQTPTMTTQSTQTDFGSHSNDIVTLTDDTETGFKVSNYNIIYVSGKLTVNRRSLTITSGSAVVTLASAPAKNDKVIVSYPGFVVGGSGVECVVSATGLQSTVGESLNTVDLKWATGAKDYNYDITYQLGRLAVVENGKSSVVANGYSGDYDGQAHGGTVVTSIIGATIAYSTDGITYVSEAPTRTDAGVTTVRVRVVKDTLMLESSYDIMISPRNVTLTAGSDVKVYDGKALTCDEFAVSGDGFVDTEQPEITMTAASKQTNVGIGSNAIVPLTDDVTTGFKAANYNITYVNGSLEVNPLKLTVVSGSAVKTASVAATEPAANANVEVSAPGFVEKQGVAECTVVAVGSQSAVGESPNTVAYRWAEGASADNYEITECLGRLVVVEDSAAVAVATGYTGIYDGQAHGGKVVTNIEGSSIMYSTDGGSSWSTKAPTRTDASETDVKVKVSKDSTILECSYKIVIERRNLELTAGSATKVYDGDTLICNNVVVGGDGYVDGEEAKLTIEACTPSTTTPVTLKDAGIADNVITKVEDQGKFNTGNYKTTKTNGLLEIKKRTVVLLSKSAGILEENKILYDGADHTFKEVTDVGKGTITGKVVPNVGFVTEKGEGATYDNFTVCTDAGTYRNDYEYTLNSNTKAQNYDIRKCMGVIKISARNVTLSSPSDSKMFDGAPLTNDNITVGGDGFIDGEGATYDVTGTQTEVGKSFNEFTYTLNDGTKPINYEIGKDVGILDVYDNTTLRVEVPESNDYTFDCNPHGEPAKAYIGEEEYEGPIWYSVDGGATSTDLCPTRTAVGTTEVLVFVEQPGYTRAEGKYTITVNPAEPGPVTPGEMDVINVNQDDLDAVAKQFIDDDQFYSAYAYIEVDKNTEAEPGDLDKIKLGAPGKQLKYSNVKLLLNAYDKYGNPTKEGYDIGDLNKVPVRITYHSDLTNQTDFQALRVHKGDLAELPLGAESAINQEYWVMNQDAGTVMVSAIKYSTYAFAYNWVPGTPDVPSDSTASATSSAATGDSTAGMLFGLAALVVCSAGVLLIKRRRFNANNN